MDQSKWIVDLKTLLRSNINIINKTFCFIQIFLPSISRHAVIYLTRVLHPLGYNLVIINFFYEQEKNLHCQAHIIETPGQNHVYVTFTSVLKVLIYDKRQ